MQWRSSCNIWLGYELLNLSILGWRLKLGLNVLIFSGDPHALWFELFWLSKLILADLKLDHSCSIWEHFLDIFSDSSSLIDWLKLPLWSLRALLRLILYLYYSLRGKSKLILLIFRGCSSAAKVYLFSLRR